MKAAFAIERGRVALGKRGALSFFIHYFCYLCHNLFCLNKGAYPHCYRLFTPMTLPLTGTLRLCR